MSMMLRNSVEVKLEYLSKRKISGSPVFTYGQQLTESFKRLSGGLFFMYNAFWKSVFVSTICKVGFPFSQNK